MLKSWDRVQVILLFVIGLILSDLLFSQDKKTDYFANLITFLSIVFGFQMTAFSILFSSKSLSTFAKLDDKRYLSRLLRLSAYFKFTFLSELFFVFLIFISKPFELTNILILPIFTIVSWCFYKILKVLFEFFETQRN